MKRFVTVVSVLGLLALSGTAHAAFPGQNGKIAYLTDQNQLYTINPDGSGATQIPLSDNCGRQGVAWTADGSSLAIGSCTRIAVLAADGSGYRYVGNGFRAGSWSPDSSRLVYTGGCPLGPTCSIRRGNADGSGETTLTSTDAISNAKWSPTGDVIAFARSDGIYTMTPDGLAQTKIPHTGQGDNPESWSPDGRRLAFMRSETGGNYDIYTIGKDGSGDRQLTSDGRSAAASWSPDGTKIVFSSARTGSNQLYVMNADGSGQTQITTSLGGFYNDWQPIPYTGYPRPRGATPFLTYLVPAYKQCVPPGNKAHGAPLAFPSCNPPQQASDYLTLGTPDANGLAAGTIGSVRLRAVVGGATPADLKVDVNISRVLSKATLAPYNGELQPLLTARITDKDNSPSPGEATMVDIPFPFTVPCGAGACALATSMNATIPGSVAAGQRAIWQVDQVKVNDGGADGVVSTADNTLFMDQGIFIP